MATQVGDRAPDIVLADTEGKTVRSADYRDRQHLVLVFNRGFA